MRRPKSQAELVTEGRSKQHVSKTIAQLRALGRVEKDLLRPTLAGLEFYAETVEAEDEEVE